MKNYQEFSDMLTTYHNLSLRSQREKKNLVSNEYIRRFYRCWIDGSFKGESHYKENLNFVKRFYNNDFELKIYAYNQFIDFINHEFGINKNTIREMIHDSLKNFEGNESFSPVMIFDNFINDIKEDLRELFHIPDNILQCQNKIAEGLKTYGYIDICPSTGKSDMLIDYMLDFMDSVDYYKHQSYYEEVESIIKEIPDIDDIDIDSNIPDILNCIVDSMISDINDICPIGFYCGFNEGDSSLDILPIDEKSDFL